MIEETQTPDNKNDFKRDDERIHALVKVLIDRQYTDVQIVQEINKDIEYQKQGLGSPFLQEQ